MDFSLRLGFPLSMLNQSTVTQMTTMWVCVCVCVGLGISVCVYVLQCVYSETCSSTFETIHYFILLNFLYCIIFTLYT